MPGYVQQYDHKGNPFNDYANARQEAQIRAKNEVLETVGVCERKNKQRLDLHQPFDGIQFSSEEWSSLAEAENDIGSTVFMLADLVSVVVPWSLDNLRRRIQAGLISTSIPFTVILTSEWHAMSSHGVGHALNYVSAGATLELISRIAAIYIDQWLDESFANLKGSIRRLKISSSRKTLFMRTTKHIRNLYVADCLFFAVRKTNKNSTQTLIYLYLSPLPVFSLLQRLHLPYNQPATHLSYLTQALHLPPLAAFIPSHPLSPLNWAWSSGAPHLPFSHSLLQLTTSPVSICLTLQVINTWADQQGNFCTDYNMPAYAAPADESREHESAPWFLKPAVGLRDWLLDHLGWSYRSLRLYEHSQGDNVEEDGALQGRKKSEPTTKENRPRGWRATQLSYVPAEILARRLHALSWNIILLSLETMLVRSMVKAYTHSPLMGDSMALTNYTNDGEGSMLAQASKIGLCFALQIAVDTIVWGCTYSTTVYLGVTRFHWGKT